MLQPSTLFIPYSILSKWRHSAFFSSFLSWFLVRKEQDSNQCRHMQICIRKLHSKIFVRFGRFVNTKSSTTKTHVHLLHITETKSFDICFECREAREKNRTTKCFHLFILDTIMLPSKQQTMFSIREYGHNSQRLSIRRILLAIWYDDEREYVSRKTWSSISRVMMTYEWLMTFYKKRISMRGSVWFDLISSLRTYTP